MKVKHFLILPFAIVALVACGQSNSGGSNTSSNSTNGAQSTPATNPSTPPASWQDVTSAMNSTVSGGPYTAFPLINIDPTAQTIQLRIPMLPLSLGSLTPILPTALPGYAGVSIGPATMPDGTLGWELTVPLSLLLKNAAAVSPLATLPNEDPLPYFPSEEVDGVAITVNQFKYPVTVYIALKAVAVFVGVPELPIPIGFGYDLVNKDQSRNIGYLALIPVQGKSPGGLYLAAQIPTDVSLELNSLVSF